MLSYFDSMDITIVFTPSSFVTSWKYSMVLLISWKRSVQQQDH